MVLKIRFVLSNREKTMAFPYDGKRFKKGVSGNPKGRPKKIPELKELLVAVLADQKDGITAAQAILAALRAKALKGDVRAIELLLDRAYGKVKQDVELGMKLTEVIMPKPPKELDK
jgi:hypothetical protein